MLKSNKIFIIGMLIWSGSVALCLYLYLNKILTMQDDLLGYLSVIVIFLPFITIALSLDVARIENKSSSSS